MIQSYAYDKLNRLTSVSENGQVIATYTYDNKGNRTQSVSNGETTTYTYDNNGNQTSKTVSGNVVASYQYNCYNQLIQASVDGTTASYTYAPDGLRSKKTVGNCAAPNCAVRTIWGGTITLRHFRLSKKAREHKRRKDKGKFFSKTNIDQKQMHAYLKSLEVSNFKGFSAYFARMSPLGVYTYTAQFHSDNLTPFWTVSSVSINLSTR